MTPERGTCPRRVEHGGRLIEPEGGDAIRCDGYGELAGPTRELQHTLGMFFCEIEIERQVRTDGQERVVQLRVLVELEGHDSSSDDVD